MKSWKKLGDEGLGKFFGQDSELSDDVLPLDTIIESKIYSADEPAGIVSSTEDFYAYQFEMGVKKLSFDAMFGPRRTLLEAAQELERTPTHWVVKHRHISGGGGLWYRFVIHCVKPNERNQVTQARKLFRRKPLQIQTR